MGVEGQGGIRGSRGGGMAFSVLVFLLIEIPGGCGAVVMMCPDYSSFPTYKEREYNPPAQSIPTNSTSSPARAQKSPPQHLPVSSTKTRYIAQPCPDTY